MPQAAPIFVSHCHEDNTWCRAFVDGLRQAGANVWYDEHNLGYGALQKEIERELRARPIFIVILSPTAVTKPWVQREMNAAIGLKDQDDTRIILPVVAEKCDVPLLWRDYKRTSGPSDTGLAASDAACRVAHALALAPASAPTASAPTAPTPAGESPHPSRVLPMKSHLRLRSNPYVKETPYATAQQEYERGNGLCEESRYQEALVAYDRALSLDPNNALAWSNKGDALRHLNLYRQSLVAYDRALSLDPKNAGVWNNKAVALWYLGQHQESLDAVERSLALEPSRPESLTTKTGVLASIQHDLDSLSVIDRALERDPNMEANWHAKAVVLRALGREREALYAELREAEARAKALGG